MEILHTDYNIKPLNSVKEKCYEKTRSNEYIINIYHDYQYDI